MTRTFTVASLAMIVAAFAAACASGHAQEDVTRLTWSADTLVLEPHLLRDLTDSSARGDEILRPMNVRAASGYLFVSDVGADRVAVLDSAASIIRWIGTRGHGPGELSGVSHLAIRGERLLIGEALNGRVSEFTFAGAFVRTYVSPFAAGALSASAHAMLSVAQSSTHYASLLGGDAEPALALRRARMKSNSRRERWSAMPGHDLIASDSQSTWVLDQATASLCRYDTPGAISRCSVLPADLLTRLREYREARVASIEAATHLHVEAAPVAKDMVRVGVWLALLLPLPELPVLLIDTTDGSLTPVVFLQGSLPPWIRSARSFAWDGHGFAIVGDDAVGRLFISRRPQTN